MYISQSNRQRDALKSGTKFLHTAGDRNYQRQKNEQSLEVTRKERKEGIDPNRRRPKNVNHPTAVNEPKDDVRLCGSP